MQERRMTNLVNMDRVLWKKLKIQALKEDRKVCELLEEAIRFYLDNKAKHMANKVN